MTLLLAWPHVGPTMMAFAAIFATREDLKVGLAVQAADGFPLKRHDVINLEFMAAGRSLSGL